MGSKFNKTGYTGVYCRPMAGNRVMWYARYMEDQKRTTIGPFETRDDAAKALFEQRRQEGSAVVSSIRKYKNVNLHLSARSPTGYLNVHARSGRFRAMWQGDGHVSLGLYDTAEEAALAYARCLLRGGPHS